MKEEHRDPSDGAADSDNGETDTNGNAAIEHFITVARRLRKQIDDTGVEFFEHLFSGDVSGAWCGHFTTFATCLKQTHLVEPSRYANYAAMRRKLGIERVKRIGLIGTMALQKVDDGKIDTAYGELDAWITANGTALSEQTAHNYVKKYITRRRVVPNIDLDDLRRKLRKAEKTIARRDKKIVALRELGAKLADEIAQLRKQNEALQAGVCQREQCDGSETSATARAE